MSRTRVLLSAFACDPYFGSDEEVGWQWARELSARGLDVTVLTRRSHQAAIEQERARSDLCADVHFEYLDIGWLHRLLTRVNRRNHLYYYAWQLQAWHAARRLHRQRRFQLIHHVTWVSFRQPSFLGLLDAPFYFGPVAGGDEIPRGYTSGFTTKRKLIEAVRAAVNAVVRFDPLMRLTYSSASKVFFTSEGHLLRVPASIHAKSVVELAIGCDLASILPPAAQAPVASAPRLLFVGRCIALKGMDIGLRIFAEIRQRIPGATLTVIGDGDDCLRWQASARAMGLADAIEWRGWLPKDEVLRLYREFDLLFNPSLRDSGGFNVIEALQNGVPVVCFKLGGPGLVVDDTCGKAVPAEPDIARTIDRYAGAVVDVLARADAGHDWAGACRRRAGQFAWDALIGRIYAPFLEKAPQ